MLYVRLYMYMGDEILRRGLDAVLSIQYSDGTKMSGFHPQHTSQHRVQERNGATHRCYIICVLWPLIEFAISIHFFELYCLCVSVYAYSDAYVYICVCVCKY